MSDFLNKGRIELFDDNTISFGNLKTQYDKELERLLKLEKYKEAAELKAEAISKGVKID